MNKICVYTVITGDYDSLKEIEFIDKNIDYYCFTNNSNINSKTWKVVNVNNDGLDNKTLSRKIKILGNEITKKYDLNIYIDGSVNLLKPISLFLKDCCDLNKFEMVGFKHQVRDCIYDELNAVAQLNKDTIENLSKTEEKLISEKYPKHNGLNENGVLIRKNVESVNHLMKEWYSFVKEYSRRDQLSFNYCLWKCPIKIQILDMNMYDNKYFKYENHVINHDYIYQIYQGNINNFDFHNIIEDKCLFESNNIIIKSQINKSCNEIYFKLNQIDILGFSKIEIFPKTDYFIFNNNVINNTNYIIGDPIIVFRNHQFNIGDEVEIIISIVKTSYNDLIVLANNLSNTINDLSNNVNNLNGEVSSLNSEKLILKNSNDELQNNYNNLKDYYNKLADEYNKVINSKGWKILEKLRKFKLKK
jgi:hypothetical protein